MMQKTRTGRVLAATLALLVVLALPAFAEGKKGEANITPQTTMKELRENPSIADSGFYTYSQDKDCPPGQRLWERTTLEQYTNRYVAQGSADGMNLVIENYNAGVKVTHLFYTMDEIAQDSTKAKTALFYFPAKEAGAKYALVIPGSGWNESAELEEGACTAWQLHEMGYAVFVLRYRIWTDAGDNAPLEDIGRAVRYITEHAAEFAIQPENYAIVGYSMGGHLTGLFGSDAVGYKNYQVPEPAALLLGYPVNNMTLVKGAYRFLQDPGIREPRYYTMNVSDYVTDDFPATYHWHGKDDVTLFALNAAQQEPVLEAALAAHNVPHKYIVYDHAPHVSGIGTGTDADGWLYDAAAFWEEQAAQNTAQQPAA